MILPDKNLDSIVTKIKELRKEKGPKKWNDPQQIEWEKLIAVFVMSDFDIEQTYPVLIDYMNKYSGSQNPERVEADAKLISAAPDLTRGTSSRSQDY
jgi:hypothetical protein